MGKINKTKQRSKIKRRPNPIRRNDETRSNSSRNQRRSSEAIDSMEKVFVSERNDYSWYNEYPEYTNYAGTIPFGKPLGNKFDLRRDNTPSNMVGYETTLPGVMTLLFTPTVGYTEDRNSPINRSSVRWYSKLRKEQRASADYDSQDMMMTYVATDSLAMFHELGKLIIGIANNSSVLNRYMPEGLLTALGVDPLDVRNNIADWWGYVNKFGIDANNVTMPKDLDLRKRHSWMCSGFYTDGQTERSQIYIFRPYGFWVFNNTAETGTELNLVQWASATTGSKITLSDYKRIGNMLLSNIFADEDVATISGDTIRALGKENCITFEMIPRDYVVQGIYSQVVLSQIENSYAAGLFAQSYTPVISQDPSVNNGAILFKPITSVFSSVPANVVLQHNGYINFHWKNPSVEDVIEATRLRTGLANVDGTSNLITMKSFGSEILHGYYTYSSDPNDPQTFIESPLWSNEFIIRSDNTVSVTTAVMKGITSMFAFDWCPTFYVTVGDATNELVTYNYCGALLDYETTTILTGEQLDNMHEAALTSEFSISENLMNASARQ